MKKLLGIVMAMAMVIGSAAGANATDIKIKGYFDFAFGWYSNTGFYDASTDRNNTGNDEGFYGYGSEENFDATQRLRFQIDFVASEQLSGTVQFEIGTINWGHGGGDTWGWGETGRGSGGAMGSDGVNVETKHMYIDWIVPETDLSIRMGLLPFALPYFANGAMSGNAILDDDLAGVVASYTFNEYVAVNLAWLRPWNPFTDSDFDRAAFTDHDSIDLIALTIPLTFAEYGLEITPWGMYGFIGEVDTDEQYLGDDPIYDQPMFGPSNFGAIGGGLGGMAGLGQDGQAWWAGISLNLTYWDPFFFAVDFMYGSYTSDDYDLGFYDPSGAWNSLGNFDNDRDGWAVSAKLGYKFEEVTPTLFGWYGSGVDGDDVSLDGLMPTLSPDWGFTSFGWSNNYGIFREGIVNGNNITGTWGIGLGFEDIKLVEGLTNNLRVAYFQGTNDSNMNSIPFFYRQNPALWGGYLYSEDDWGVEVNLDSVYQIMEGLELYNQIGYLHVDIDESSDWSDTDDAWEFAVGFRYTF